MASSDSVRLRIAIEHLPQAISVLQNYGAVHFDHVSLSGACALWYHAFSIPNPAANLAQWPIRDPEKEVFRIVDVLRFLPFFIPYRFEVQHRKLRGRREDNIQLPFHDGSIPIDIDYQSYLTSSTILLNAPVRVNDGIWIILDILEDFLESTALLIKRPHHAVGVDVYGRHVARTSLAIVALFLYALERLALCRPSLGLFGLDYRHQEEYDSIRKHPRFARSRTALQWFCTFRRISQIGKLGSEYYDKQLSWGWDETEGYRDELASRIQASLLYWQSSFRVLVPETRSRAFHEKFVFPQKYLKLLQLLDDPHLDLDREPDSRPPPPSYADRANHLQLFVTPEYPYKVTSDPPKLRSSHRVLEPRT